jgi:transcription termination factor NusB
MNNKQKKIERNQRFVAITLVVSAIVLLGVYFFKLKSTEPEKVLVSEKQDINSNPTDKSDGYYVEFNLKPNFGSSITDTKNNQKQEK